MSEKMPGGQEEIRLTISHEEAIANPEVRPRYVEEREAAKKNGQKVWEIRDIHLIDAAADGLITYDYYFKEVARGYILGNDGVGYDVRGAVFEATMYGIEQHGLVNLSLEGPKENFYEAKKTLEDYVHGTVPPELVVE